jgi:hypothetical protein
MGIEAFAERARRELDATGETPRKRTVETTVEVTAQETQIGNLTGTEEPPSVRHNRGHQPTADRNHERPTEAERAARTGHLRCGLADTSTARPT